MAIATGDSVIVEYTGRLEDGTVFDTSRESVAEESGLSQTQTDRNYDPLTIKIGAGEVIEGLEDGLVGLEEGDESTITVPPEKGYGERSDDQLEEYERAELEEILQQDPEVGMRIKTQQGDIGEISNVGSKSVRIDFSHQLAGETLVFDVEIVNVS